MWKGRGLLVAVFTKDRFKSLIQFSINLLNECTPDEALEVNMTLTNSSDIRHQLIVQGNSWYIGTRKH